ncbi:MAG: DUF418 domain-containing protein [Chitinophagaceae bacterium]|jgi:uncharacterized protein|nr:DUF418 domain-containing protein [Chitinophagaceae bacterium]MBK7679863.1 DUF418 domain-containing protein [Chitinophagaceae bacterium]MBK8301047.1 DUF418 domain-containing protein [Chitinophagaceae bacterium]MBK9937564.1 DUF418 domain-containing protein [Chitinophagaceae bacterium]MBP6233955.1 DUF418 domain-containing protein [Chitinophagaceae bacterium]
MTSQPSANLVAPTGQQERIIILDSLRGFAILGILLMNIPSFGLPVPTGHDPSVLNEWNTINFKVWHFVDWFPEGTQRAIFSMLFGAGILLFVGGKEKRLEGLLPADYFFRRQLWLIVFSLFDVFVLLWWGDILLDYACLGMIMYSFRKLSPKALLIGAALCFTFMLARENRELYQDKKIIRQGEMIAAMDTAQTKLTVIQKEQLGAMQDFKAKTTPEGRIKRMEKAILKTQGSYENLYEYRTNRYIDDLVKYLFFGIWDVLLFMFLGMAFFKMGILTGQANIKVYWGMCIIGLGAGLTLSYFRLQPLIAAQFNWYEYTKNISFSFYELSRTFRSIGILGLLMLLYKSGLFKWLFALLRPVGQMAFTNYLMQSLLCGLFFYGIGFGMYGKLERHEVYYVVGAVWLVQIIYSNIWLHYFRFGPMEWAWRSLTYWKKQPMKKSNPKEVLSP